MSSDKSDDGAANADGATVESVEYLLFDSLVHQLIEKGLLTKNDALSVVQTVAQVVQGRMHDHDRPDQTMRASLAALERTYFSFEALSDRSDKSGLDAHNVHQLRTPIHGNHPHFPSADDD